MTVWVGIDPGARNTGVVAMRGRDILWAKVFTNPGPLIPEPAYLVGTADAIYGRVAGAFWGEIGEDLPRFAGEDLPRFAIEGVSAPKGFAGGKRSPLNPEAIIGAAATFGALVATFRDAIIVPPGGNGSKPMGAYPRELVSAAEQRKPGWAGRVGESSNARHMRSAYDVILKARIQARAAV